MSRIVRFHSLGDASVLKLEETDIGDPGPGEVKFKVKGLGLNRAEVLFREGRYLEAPQLPSRIGYEAAGYVDKVGEGVKEFKTGDYVSSIPSFSQTRYGVYGEEAIVPAKALVKMPPAMKATEAASIWMQYLTAYGALIELGKLQKDQFVVVTAASSSVGFAAIQIIKDVGGKSIATTRTSKKKDVLLKAGADHVIATDEEDVCDRILEVTKNKGADIVFDAVAGSMLVDLARATKFEGLIFIYGALRLETTPFPLRIALKKGLNICGYTMFQMTGDEGRLERGKKYVSERLESGVFKPVIDREFTLDQIVEAHEYMESNQQAGKIVVAV